MAQRRQTTSDRQVQGNSSPQAPPIPKRRVRSLSREERQAIITLILLLKQVDTTSPQSKLNAISIDDNNGGRIYL